MALLSKTTTTGNPSLATKTPPASAKLTKECAADIGAGDMVYITSADKFDKANGAAANALAQWWGMASHAAKSGQPLTAYHSVEFDYGTGLTPGARYYLATTAGRLDTATTTGGDIAAAFATSATRIFVKAPGK